MAGLLLFRAPLDQFEEIIGPTLFVKVRKQFIELNEENQNCPWNNLSRRALKTYLKEHDYIVDQMCTRIMMNLISADAIRL